MGRHLVGTLAALRLVALVLPSAVAPAKRRGSRAITSREREVLRLLADGKAYREIALELAISHRSVSPMRSSSTPNWGSATARGPLPW